MRKKESKSEATGARRVERASRLVALFVLLLASVASASAQQQGTPPTPKASPTPEAKAQAAAAIAADVLKRDDRYRIGPDDVLDIRIFNKPLLSRDSVRVDGNGMIRMPLIEGEIQAACKSERELEADIAKLYLKYLRRPQVNVFVKEFHSQPVAVIGAVNTPGRFQLQRRVTLLELLTYANGPAERHGQHVQVIHFPVTSLVCEDPNRQKDSAGQTADADDEVRAAGFVSFRLEDTMRGEEKANPFIRAGDIITLPDADQVYVVGNVNRPTPIPLREPITVSRAIAMAGGTMPDTKKDRVRIIRQTPGTLTKTEIYVDLNAIDKKKAEDVALMPNDVVDVPTSSGKRLIKSFLGSFVPGAAQLPLRVIP